MGNRNRSETEKIDQLTVTEAESVGLDIRWWDGERKVKVKGIADGFG